ncbi:actin cortical patch SUR7/pH-response regulator pali [Massariosphaeria phaeospora]|uniref:Actin cortical patch SUR7/pH-response regulator pali n=1 Tax=Massariosphaeria phaeospora TaxID=100035 RepID=A0A7C8M5X0_9PLEO|nr:actin cortical patch SUR7/pH-response regulator pali [Massariosphaeria phaeospora]
MRLLAIVPILCCLAALILSFLCLFAGSKGNLMEDYHLLTLNTSRIGQNLLDNGGKLPFDLPGSELLTGLPDEFTDTVSDAIGDIAERLGVEDFYSAHILDYCYGQYTPIEVANATVSASDISKNITGCSNRTAAFAFDPNEIIEQALNKSGLGITLRDLEWPQDIQRGIDALRIISIVTFALYCIAIGLIGLSLILAIFGLFANGRMLPCCNLLLAILAFLASGLASGLVTAVLVKGTEVINQYGGQIGIEADRGNKFLALTWAATAVMFVAVVIWCIDMCIPRRNKHANNMDKHG